MEVALPHKLIAVLTLLTMLTYLHNFYMVKALQENHTQWVLGVLLA